MKSHLKALIAAIGVVGVMPLAHALPDDDFAPVTRVTPHVTTVNEPQQVCHTETVPVQHNWYGDDDIHFQQVQTCHMVNHYTTRTDGYTVTYVYQGRAYTTEMPYDPGGRVHVTVDVQPS